MIIITARAPELADWIDENLISPYLVSKPWHSDLMGWCQGGLPIEFDITLDPTDALLFDLRWRGSFIYNPRNDRWYDNTEINQLMLDIGTRR